VTGVGVIGSPAAGSASAGHRTPCDMPTPEDESDAKAVARQPSPSELAAHRILVLLQSAHEENQVTAAHEVRTQ